MKRDASRAVFSGRKGEMEGVDGYTDAIKACAVRYFQAVEIGVWTEGESGRMVRMDDRDERLSFPVA